MERLQKVLAHAGVASRRAAEKMIVEGRVRVNGVRVTELGTRVDPAADTILVDGRKIARAPAHRTYLMLNKPRGCVTTLSDPEGRRCLADLLRGVRARVYPVGRLDFHSEGLLLLTDDGPLARDLMHPSKGVNKTYRVKVSGRPDAEALGRLRRGVRLHGKRAAAVAVRLVRPDANAWLEITVAEGRKHLVRRLCEAVGHRVMKLRRIRYDGLALGELPPGQLRPLTPAEVATLRRAARRRQGPDRP